VLSTMFTEGLVPSLAHLEIDEKRTAYSADSLVTFVQSRRTPEPRLMTLKIVNQFSESIDQLYKDGLDVECI